MDDGEWGHAVVLVLVLALQHVLSILVDDVYDLNVCMYETLHISEVQLIFKKI